MAASTPTTKEGWLALAQHYRDNAADYEGYARDTWEYSQYVYWIGQAEYAEEQAANFNTGGGGSSDTNFIAGTSGADSIYNSIASATIAALGGADRITNSGSSVSIDGGADDDRIYNGYKKNSNSSSSITLISAYSSNNTVDGDDGNDYIENYSSSSSIVGGAGNDSIINGYDRLSTGTVVSGGSGDTVEGGAGNDSIRNYAERSLIDGGDGDDTITNATAGLTRDGAVKSTVKGGNGNDDIWNSRASVSIDGGAGNDTIFNNGSSVTINAGEGNDLISLSSSGSQLILYNSGNGNDSVVGFNSSSTLHIDGGSGSYSTTKSGSDVIVTVGEGKITLKGAATLSGLNIVGASSGGGSDTTSGGGNDTGSGGGSSSSNIIRGTWSADSIENTLKSVEIQAYGGNDTIRNGGTIDSGGTSVTISGGTGNDYIYNIGERYVSINGGDGDDYIDNYGHDITIEGGLGNDYIFNHYNSVSFSEGRGGGFYIAGYNVKINAGSGDDTIDSGSSSVTITGGAGDDLIRLNTNAYHGARHNLILYKAGDGNDSVTGFNDTSTLKIDVGSGTYSTVASDSDIIVTVGEGKITLAGAATLSTINIEQDLTSLIFDNKTDSAVSLSAQTEIVDASKRTKPIKITANSQNNSIVGGRGNDTIDEPLGNNTLAGGKGSDLFIFSAGDNVITDYEKKDKISIDGGLSYAGFAVDGDDVILNLGDDSLTVKDGAGKAVNLNSTVNFYTTEGVFDKDKKSVTLAAGVENFTASSALKTIDGSATGAIEIIGNKKANFIVAGMSGSTLAGGKGKDSLVGGDGADVFVYNKKDGKDVIENFGAGDTISLGSDATIKSSKIKSGDTIFKIGSGSLTVKDTTQFTFFEGEVEKIFSDGNISDADETSITLASTYSGTFEFGGYKTADASLTKKAVKLVGNEQDNYLVGGKKNDSLLGGAGADSLWGGKGKDSLWGGAGDDTFIFRAGDGTNTIFDYASGELLTILDKRGNEGTFKKATFSENTLTLSINGGGKVILKNVSDSTAFNINGSTRHVSDLVR